MQKKTLMKKKAQITSDISKCRWKNDSENDKKDGDAPPGTFLCQVFLGEMMVASRIARIFATQIVSHRQKWRVWRCILKGAPEKLDKSEDYIEPKNIKVPYNFPSNVSSKHVTYLSEFFKLSLVGLWLGEVDEWPNLYSWRESIVGFFGMFGGM